MADISTNALVPTNAGEVMSGAAWGIDGTLTGFIIQSEDFNDESVTDQTQDQKGRVVYELDYDKHYTCTLQVIGNGSIPDASTEDFEWYATPEDSASPTGKDKVKWRVRSVTYNGSYNDKKKYTINLERWENYPAQNA